MTLSKLVPLNLLTSTRHRPTSISRALSLYVLLSAEIDLSFLPGPSGVARASTYALRHATHSHRSHTSFFSVCLPLSVKPVSVYAIAASHGSTGIFPSFSNTFKPLRIVDFLKPHPGVGHRLLSLRRIRTAFRRPLRFATPLQYRNDSHVMTLASVNLFTWSSVYAIVAIRWLQTRSIRLGVSILPGESAIRNRFKCVPGKSIGRHSDNVDEPRVMTDVDRFKRGHGIQDLKHFFILECKSESCVYMWT